MNALRIAVAGTIALAAAGCQANKAQGPSPIRTAQRMTKQEYESKPVFTHQEMLERDRQWAEALKAERDMPTEKALRDRLRQRHNDWMKAQATNVQLQKQVDALVEELVKLKNQG